MISVLPNTSAVGLGAFALAASLILISVSPAIGLAADSPSNAMAEDRATTTSASSDAKALIGRPGVKVIDACGKLFFRAGHIPGALNLARRQFETDFAVHEAALRGKEIKTLVVYCGDPSCDDSSVVAEALRKRGFPQVLVYRGGWEEWRKSRVTSDQ